MKPRVFPIEAIPQYMHIRVNRVDFDAAPEFDPLSLGCLAPFLETGSRVVIGENEEFQLRGLGTFNKIGRDGSPVGI